MFWIAAGLLVVFACAFVLLPLLLVRKEDVADVDRDQINVALYRERSTELEDESLRQEAQKDLLSDTTTLAAGRLTLGNRRTLLVAALLLPLLAVMVYADFGLGRGSIVDVGLADSLARLDAGSPAGYAAFAERIEQRLEVRPDNQDLQYLLASLYSSLGRYEAAADLYADMLQRFPDDPNLLSSYAEVLFVADGRQLTTRASAAVEAALRANPVDLTMLEISGIGAMSAGNLEQALGFFNRALQTGITGERAELIRMAVARIHENLGTTMEPAAGRVINASVSLAEDIDVPETAVVFVYARAAEGPPAPLAVRRFPVTRLPVEVRLDETMAMVPAMSLANFDEVIVIARVSLTGDVAPASGDVEARTGVIKLADEAVAVQLEMADVLQ